MPKCLYCNKSYYGDIEDHWCQAKKTAHAEEDTKVAQSTVKQESVSKPAPVENLVTKVENPPQSKDGPKYDVNAKDRVKRWRESNREEYNRYMREYRKRKTRQSES